MTRIGIKYLTFQLYSHSCLHYFLNCINIWTGYKEDQIDVLMDDTNPSLALLADWILAGGNTGVAVDMLLGYLDKLGRDDVAYVIKTGRGTLSNTHNQGFQ